MQVQMIFKADLHTHLNLLYYGLKVHSDFRWGIFQTFRKNSFSALHQNSFIEKPRQCMRHFRIVHLPLQDNLSSQRQKNKLNQSHTKEHHLSSFELLAKFHSKFYGSFAWLCIMLDLYSFEESPSLNSPGEEYVFKHHACYRACKQQPVVSINSPQ